MTASVPNRIAPAKRMHRFYRLDVQPDLFGQWCLMREADRIGTAWRDRSIPFPTRQEVLGKQHGVKERRGYECHWSR
jgi:predicted DNA-binding WGR domain protein